MVDVWLQVPEYGRSLEESVILENSFQIIFAFDEIVALGYRESVNLAQINTLLQMDSHEEKVARALIEVGVSPLLLSASSIYFCCCFTRFTRHLAIWIEKSFSNYY